MKTFSTPRQANATAIVVTHNRCALLKRCLSAIRQQSLRPPSILVIDNGSTDSTPAWLSKQHDLHVVRQPNLGGAAGFARGLAEGAHFRSDHMWIMDDDCLPAPDCLERLLASPVVAGGESVVGSLPLSTENPDELAFPMPVVSSYRRVRGWYGRLTTRPADLVREADSVGYPFGAFFLSVLFPRNITERVGVPRADYFISGDEVEYFYRVRRAGYSTYIILDSVVRHPPSREARSPWKEAYGVRNTVLIHREYFPWPRLRIVHTFLKLLIRRRFDLMRPLLDGVRRNMSRSYLPRDRAQPTGSSSH